MNTKIIGTVTALLGLVAVVAAEKRIQLPKVRVTAEVVDEQGAAVAGATVKLVFGAPYNANDIVRVEGNTNTEGRFVGQGHTGGTFGASVNKEGFYMSGLSVPPLNDIINGKSQDVICRSVLRPMGKPVPLYAKTGWFDIPLVGRPCGFDLMQGDWVSPHGRGSVADLVFTLERRHESRNDFEVKVRLSFSNPRDGIQETKLPEIGRNSAFKWEREAPEQGYETELTSRFAHLPGKSYEATANENQAYFFRVRSIEQNGRIVSALYGKIKGGLQLAPSNSSTCKINLTYYLNPTPLDRNLEWDTKRNLLSGLSPMETPRDP